MLDNDKWIEDTLREEMSELDKETEQKFNNVKEWTKEDVDL